MLRVSLFLIIFSTTVGQSPVTFNVLDYGAKGDDHTNNTAAFTTCLNALVAAGGGRMYLPTGIYRGRIIIPPVQLARWLTVEIVGDTEPTPRFGTIGSIPYSSNSTSIVKSTEKSGTAVISAAPATDQYGDFSDLYVVVTNLEIRTYDNPGISGIDLQYAQQCKLHNVFENTNIYDVQASLPTHDTAGVITPAVNNGALTILRNVAVTGYATGIVANEHTDGDSISLYGNLNGIRFLRANHASRFGRLGAYRNAVHINVTGSHGFSIQQLAIENAGPGQTTPANKWQALQYDSSDPDNHGVADLTYWVVEGNVGPVETFIKNGGNSIQARRIGSAPVCHNLKAD
jgi:hypothetical protein